MEPLGYRVLSMLPTVYRLWAKTRLRHLEYLGLCMGYRRFLVVALGGSGVRAAGTCLHRRRSTGRWAREKPTCTCEDKRVVRAGSALSMLVYL